MDRFDGFRQRLSFVIVVPCLFIGAILPGISGSRDSAKESDFAATLCAERDEAPARAADSYVVLAYNDLGMHCMNPDFSEMCILPPFNNLRAQVIKRDSSPDIVKGDVTVRYSIPGNTTSADKTDFWDYAADLFGIVLPDDIGLTGNGLVGEMESPSGHGHWEASGIPVTPLDDNFQNNPFQLSHVEVTNENGALLAETFAVVPVSWEINCNYCHDTPGISVATAILRAHDRKHNTQLEFQKPVLCAGCHADPALGTEGESGVSMFSHAIHGSHANRMTDKVVTRATEEYIKALWNFPPDQREKMLAQRMEVHADAIATVNANACYTCHPGTNTECQRDLHLPKGITCVNCHGNMSDVASELRTPWIDEPTCAGCHSQMNPDFDYEEPGKLFKDSRGHGNIECASCHGSPHAMGPATIAEDNVQAILLQGEPGPISQCTVCHSSQPEHEFFHSRHPD